MKKLTYLLIILLCVGLAEAKLFDIDNSITPGTGCSVFGCSFIGDIYMNGNTIYNATFVNASILEHDPIFTAENASIWLAINSKYNASNPNGFINSSGVLAIGNGTWVKVTGDTMTGDLNMSNHSIWDVDILSVHNITGRSPIYINSPMISQTNITADNFYGNFQGDNGTIFGVNINNGSIVNLHVTGPDAVFDGNVSVNGTVVASDYNLQGDNIWINKQNLTFNFNETKLAAYIQNATNSSSDLVTKYFNGTDASGLDGEANRQLNTGMTVSIVNVDTFVLQPIWDYNTTGTVVTFLNNLWNDQRITVYGDSTFTSTNYLGSAFSGVSGDTNRNLTITSGPNYIIVVDNFMLQKDIDYTIVGTTLTMLNELWDDQRITVWVVE